MTYPRVFRALVPSFLRQKVMMTYFLCTHVLVHSYTHSLVHLYFILHIYIPSGNRISRVLMHSSLILINRPIYHNINTMLE